MTKSLFEKIYGIHPSNLGSVGEVDSVIEKKIGRKLQVKHLSTEDVLKRPFNKQKTG